MTTYPNEYAADNHLIEFRGGALVVHGYQKHPTLSARVDQVHPGFYVRFATFNTRESIVGMYLETYMEVSSNNWPNGDARMGRPLKTYMMDYRGLRDVADFLADRIEEFSQVMNRNVNEWHEARLQR